MLRRSRLRLAPAIADSRRRMPLLPAAMAVWAALPAGAAAQGSPEQDRAVLEAFYDATGGPDWTNDTNWKTEAPLHRWHGVSTAFGGRVNQLSLADNGLAGSIPARLGDLEYLERLDLSENGLTGPIPARLGSLARLRRLSLRENALSGPLPDALGGLENLEALDLDHNALTGPIPARLGELTGLTWLSLRGNDLSGPIPDSLGNLANVESLDLTNNALAGPIPGALGGLARLEWLSFWGNSLTGAVPDALGGLPTLGTLHLGWNPLTGPLPESLTGLSRLTRLSLQGTAACAPPDDAFQAWLADVDFTGETCNRPPEPVGAIPAQALAESGPAAGVPLEDWFSDPDDDELTYAAASSHPGSVGALVSGGAVWLVPGAAGTATVTVTASDPDGLSADQAIAVTTASSAAARGDREVLEALYDAAGGADWTHAAGWTTPAPLGEWHGVTTDAAGRVTGLGLDDNGLAGSIPPALGGLTRLEVLDLGQNALGGPIPAALGGLAGLRRLSLRENGLAGRIPGELGRLTRLEQLDLSENALTGPVPAGLGSLARLRRLSLRGNDLSGPIPGALERLADLEELYLAGNGLTGPVPAWLGGLARLRWLSLSGNDLSGEIPAALGRLASLEALYLGGNRLTGPIPAWLGDLGRLRRLSLWGNDLSGTVPDALGRLANLERLDLSNLWGLSGPLPAGLERSRLELLDVFVTRTCAPAAWRDWLATIAFYGSPCGPAPRVTVDVAVVHTANARRAAGGADEIAAVVDLMVAEANQAFEASGVDLRLVLVGRSEAAYAGTGDALIDLRRLAHPSDGYLDEAHALRERAGADLVHLILDDAEETCGIAYLPGVFGLTLLGCGGATFAHELGHNMGLRHDRYRVHHHEGGARPHPAHGYANPRGSEAGALRSNRWRTVMSYNTRCADVYAVCSRLLRFSNPRQAWNGEPLGAAYRAGEWDVAGGADAAAVLAATGPGVAAWRDRATGANRPPAARPRAASHPLVGPAMR